MHRPHWLQEGGSRKERSHAPAAIKPDAGPPLSRSTVVRRSGPARPPDQTGPVQDRQDFRVGDRSGRGDRCCGDQWEKGGRRSLVAPDATPNRPRIDNETTSTLSQLDPESPPNRPLFAPISTHRIVSESTPAPTQGTRALSLMARGRPDHPAGAATATPRKPSRYADSNGQVGAVGGALAGGSTPDALAKSVEAATGGGVGQSGSAVLPESLVGPAELGGH